MQKDDLSVYWFFLLSYRPLCMKLKKICFLSCLAFVSAFSPLAVSGENITGMVVGVSDGDTITVLIGGRDQIRVRLANIDAPEKSQPFGQRSKQALSDLVFGKPVECERSGTDRYGRTIALCHVGITNVNLSMVRSGMAWVYRMYAKNVPDYYAAEEHARIRGVGLWADKEPVPPWDWRRLDR